MMENGLRNSDTIKRYIINISKDFRISTDSFSGTFRRNLLRANHLKKWGAKLPACFRICEKGSGVARVSWRGKPVSLTGDGFLLSILQFYNKGDVRDIWIFDYYCDPKSG